MTYGSCNFAPPKNLEQVQALLASNHSQHQAAEANGEEVVASFEMIGEGEMREVEREAFHMWRHRLPVPLQEHEWPLLPLSAFRRSWCHPPCITHEWAAQVSPAHSQQISSELETFNTWLKCRWNDIGTTASSTAAAASVAAAEPAVPDPHPADELYVIDTTVAA